jgi:hypothetical protein
MTCIYKTIAVRLIFVALILLGAAQARALDLSAQAGLIENIGASSSDDALAAVSPYTFGVYSITEGMNDYPIQKQLTNTMPFSMDFSIIFAIGWTGDKLYIKLTDDGGDGDRLQGIALAQYDEWELVPYWSTVYSTTAHDSCEIVIPMYPPAIAVYLLSGYWGLSKGDQPFTYTISLSLPQ